MTLPETKSISSSEGINQYTTVVDNIFEIDLEDVTDESAQDEIRGTYTIVMTVANADNSDVTKSISWEITIDPCKILEPLDGISFELSDSQPFTFIQYSVDQVLIYFEKLIFTSNTCQDIEYSVIYTDTEDSLEATEVVLPDAQINVYQNDKMVVTIAANEPGTF